MSAEKERDLILGWLERNHPEVLSELVGACRGVLTAGSAAEALTPVEPGLIRRRTRDGKHVVTLRELTAEEASQPDNAPLNDRVYAYAAVSVEPKHDSISTNDASGWFTTDFRYNRVAEHELDLTEPA